MHAFIPDISFGEKAIRTAVVYAFLLLGLRLAGKRELSQLNPFDLVVLLLLSNTVQNAIIGNDNSLVGGIAGATFLLLINAVVVRVLFHYGKLDRIEGKPDSLIHKGRLIRRHLERELITVAELEAAARRQGIESLAQVNECRLETGGESLGMLGQIEARQRAILEQLTALERKIGGTTGTTP